MADNVPNRRKHKTCGKPPLNAKEVNFCLLLFKGNISQRQAFLEAGFEPRCNDIATDQAASRLVRKHQVRQFLRDLQNEAADSAKLTAERIGRLVANIATVDFRRLLDERGAFLPVSKWPDEVASTLGAIESEEVFEPVPGERGKKQLKGYVRKVKVSTAKVAALKLLMEWKRMVGSDRINEVGKPDPLVVGGDADPSSL